MRAYWVLLLLVASQHGSLLFAQSSEERELRAAVKKATTANQKAKTLLLLGKYYQQIDLFKADSIRPVLTELQPKVNDSTHFFIQLYDAELDKMKGNNDLYFKKVLGFQSYLSSNFHPIVKVKVYQLLGEFHTYYREFEQAEFYLRESLRLSKRIRNNAETAESLILYALQKMHLNQKDSSLIFVNEAIQYSRRSSNREITSKSLNCLAKVYDYFGQVELSVSKNLIALQLAQQAGLQARVSEYSVELGIAQMQILNYREARLYFGQALQVSQRIHYERNEARANIYLGALLLIEQKYAASRNSLQNAIYTLQRLEDVDGLGLANKFLGDLYQSQGMFAEALSHYNKALVYFESSGNREQTGNVYHNVGLVFKKQGKLNNALNYLNRSLAIRSQFGFKGAVYDVYKSISEVYDQLGKKPEAYRYLKLYTDYSDSAKTSEASAKIAELSELYRSEQREQLISMQADSIERQRQERELTSTQLENIQLKNNFQAYIILGFALVLILGGVIYFYRWNQTKIRQQQKEAEMNQTLLRAQMNPHFVFNAMSVIQSYIYDNDTKNSTKFLVAFSKLMRLILENSSKEFIPMEVEIDFLDKYLSIQKLRFEDRFEYKLIVDDSLLEEGAIIPPMITQPFIENAIEHGQLHLREDGFINVHFTKQGTMLHIIVEDNGVGRKGAAQNKKSSAHKSMAMKITRDRIENLNKKYRSEGTMEIEDYNKLEETGTKVLISIPYRVQSNQQNE